MILAKSIRANVADQQRHLLAQAFGLRIVKQVVAFGSKPDTKKLTSARGCRLGKRCENVRIFCKYQLRHLTRAVFFHFLHRRRRHTPVSHRRRCYKNSS